MTVVLAVIGVAGVLFAVVVVACQRDRAELEQEDEEDDRG